MGGDSGGETGLSDVLALIYPHADTDKVYFDSVSGDAGARNDSDGRVHVIQNDNLVVKRVSSSNTAVTEGDGL